MSPFRAKVLPSDNTSEAWSIPSKCAKTRVIVHGAVKERGINPDPHEKCSRRGARLPRGILDGDDGNAQNPG